MKSIINFFKNYLEPSLKTASIIALGIEVKSPERSDEDYNKLNKGLRA